MFSAFLASSSPSLGPVVGAGPDRRRLWRRRPAGGHEHPAAEHSEGDAGSRRDAPPLPPDGLQRLADRLRRDRHGPHGQPALRRHRHASRDTFVVKFGVDDELETPPQGERWLYGIEGTNLASDGRVISGSSNWPTCGPWTSPSSTPHRPELRLTSQRPANRPTHCVRPRRILPTQLTDAPTCDPVTRRSRVNRQSYRRSTCR